MHPNLTVIFHRLIRREDRRKKSQRQRLGKTDTTMIFAFFLFLLLSLFLPVSLPICLSCSDSASIRSTHPPPPPPPPLSITASFSTVMSAPGAWREQGRGEVLQGIRVFKIYTTVFLLWMISANRPPPTQPPAHARCEQREPNPTASLHLTPACWVLPDP